jgi:ParB/Sulfiredoxin domain
MSSSKVSAIPLELIQPHPRLAFRFRYEVDSLAESIRETADESTPNGQLNPGRVVKAEGERYYVYIGVRRFLAMETLHERTRDARFEVFNAYVDQGLSELQMFVKAKAENEEEKGERQPLSLLEQVSGIRNIRDSFEPGKAPPSIKRLLVLADRMEDARLKKMHEAEGAVGSRFTEKQLEGLARMKGDDAEFYTTAASMVAFGVEDAEVAEKKRDAAFSLAWFKRSFPEIKPETKPPPKPFPLPTVVSRPEVHEEEVLLAPCPRCGGGNLIRVDGEIEVTHVPPDPDGEAVTMVADTVTRAKLVCSHCGGEVFVFARHIEGSKYALAASTSPAFRDPREEAEALDLRFDREGDSWQRIEGDRVAGPIVLVPKKR